MTNLRPIETTYKGYRFRSRLEARWAVFFDALGVAWEYEKEGYDLDGLWYLPDFWLPVQRLWVEVKPYAPGADEQEKAKRLMLATHRPVVMLFDIPRPVSAGEDMRAEECRILAPMLWRWTYTADMVGYDEEFYVDDGGVMWILCPICGRLDATLWGGNDIAECGCISHRSALPDTYKHPRYRYRAPRLMAAYDAARSARFAHGEGGAR